MIDGKEMRMLEILRENGRSKCLNYSENEMVCPNLGILTLVPSVRIYMYI
jgi:hypothetical protein